MNSPQTEGSRDFKGKWGGGGGEQGPPGLEQGFPGGSDGKESACSLRDLGSNPGLGKASGEGNDYPLWYSCLENSIDREAWWAVIHGVIKSRMRPSDLTS